MKTFDEWRKAHGFEGEDAELDALYYFADVAVVLDPHERAIDIEEVRPFVESFYGTNPEKWCPKEYETEWAKFVKELGL